MNRFFCAPLFCAITILPALVAQAAPIVLPPGLPAGTQYRLVFSTSTLGTADSTDIDDYNAIVTASANSDPVLASLSTTWKAVASTSTVAARDNTDTNPLSMGVPIYNLGGQLVATGNADLWDGSIANPIFFDEHGNSPVEATKVVWTGAELNGTPNEPLGTDAPSWGQAYFSDPRWLFSSHGTYDYDKLFSFYAMSGVLTAVPEPGTLSLAALCGVALVWIGRRRLG